MDRSRNTSAAEIRTCLILNVLFRMPLCQTTGFGESLLRLFRLDWAAAKFSTLSKCWKPVPSISPGAMWAMPPDLPNLLSRIPAGVETLHRNGAARGRPFRTRSHPACLGRWTAGCPPVRSWDGFALTGESLPVPRLEGAAG